jgi:hypothetical protein
VLIKTLLYTTSLKILYLIVNLLETLDYLRIALTLKTRHLIVGRRNNYSFLVVYRSRYLIYLPKHLIKLVLIKRTIK